MGRLPCSSYAPRVHADVYAHKRAHIYTSCAHTYPPNTRMRTLLDVYTRLSLSGDEWQQLIVRASFWMHLSRRDMRCIGEKNIFLDPYAYLGNFGSNMKQDRNCRSNRALVKPFAHFTDQLINKIGF